MSLERLARELDETARQTESMAAGVTDALATLRDATAGSEQARNQAMQQIIHALQGQDRIEQRCRNMARAVRKLVASDKTIDHPRFDEIWSSLTLDELAVPELSGIAKHNDSGEVDLF
jgi:hypothetical protein